MQDATKQLQLLFDLNDVESFVIQLHDIGRLLESDKRYWVFGNDLRDFADRLHRVYKNYYIEITEKDQFVYDYLLATSGMAAGAKNE